MAAEAQPRKLLGVRVTADQHRILTEAARREHSPVSSFVLQAALHAATSPAKRDLPPPHITDEESQAYVNSLQKAFRESPDRDRDLLEELFEMRRQDMLLG